MQGENARIENKTSICPDIARNRKVPNKSQDMQAHPDKEVLLLWKRGSFLKHVFTRNDAQEDSSRRNNMQKNT